MAKKTKTRSKNASSRYDIARLVVMLCLVGMIGLASADVPSKTPAVTKKAVISKHKTYHKQIAAKPVATTVAKPPPPTPPPAKPPSRTVPANPSAPKVEPVVTPSPASSVSSLTPVAPTSAPPNSSGSGSTSSTGGSSGSTGGTGTTGSGSTGTPSNPPPVTTTAYTSTNWSGYFAANAAFSGISGSWTATSPTGNGTSTSADSTWIGIGGVTSGDLIQVGTQNTVTASGQVISGAFYELLPDFSQPVPGVNIKPGDSMTASITRLSGDQWNITITDTTNSQTNSQTVSYASTLSSAEWIQEDPSFSSRRQIPFDYYGSTAFTAGSTITDSGSESISASGAQPITMVNRLGQTLSIPSFLTADGAGFTVTRDNTH